MTQQAADPCPSPAAPVRTSQLVAVRDGTRLAVDLHRPQRPDGMGAVQTPLPAIFVFTPYGRAHRVGTRLSTPLCTVLPDGRESPGALAVLARNNYVVVIADVRGQGASFGTYHGQMTIQEGRDAADLIAWIARQPWCTGDVGMFGGSYSAATQFLAASERPPALKCLFPMQMYFDAYDVFFPGGVEQSLIPKTWAVLVESTAGRAGSTTVAPVDGPEGESLLESAVAEHRGGATVGDSLRQVYAVPTRDGPYFSQHGAVAPVNLVNLLPALREQALPAYHVGSFHDYYPDQTAMWYLNWTGPRKLMLGHWNHNPFAVHNPREAEAVDVIAAEALRWFDHWLKHVDNGVLDEPPVRYALQAGHPFREGEFDGEDWWEWRFVGEWPPPTSPLRLFLGPGPSGTVASSNDGRLMTDKPSARTVHARAVDGAASTGPLNRMAASFVYAPICFPEMSAVDARCLTWTSEPLPADVDVVGVPRLALTVIAEAADATTVWWLEDIDGEGRSTLVSYQSLDLRHRTPAVPPYDSGGMLYRVSTGDAVHAAQAAWPGRAALALTLLPVANRFRQGHRIRLTLAGTDAGYLEGKAGAGLLGVEIGEAMLELPVRGT